MVKILMISAKMATLVLFKIKVFWNKDYDVVIYVYDATNNVITNSNYIVYVFLWPKFSSSSMSMREVTRNSIL